MATATGMANELRIKDDTKAAHTVQSLDRGLLILEAIGKSTAPLSLTQLTRLLGIDPSNTFRLANTLKRRGFLANPAAGREYVLGPSIWRLARQYHWGNMLATIAHDQLVLLAEMTNETAHLAVREGVNALFIDHASTDRVISIAGQTGGFVPLYCSGHGKALLAGLDERALKKLFGTKPLERHTKRTICSIRALAKACAEIEALGYATDDAEFVEGVRCLAAPIRDKDGAIVGSIGISAPLTRFPAKEVPTRARQVCEIANKIGSLFTSQAS
jgi:DNA-binding IclR family transcriptional regulator